MSLAFLDIAQPQRDDGIGTLVGVPSLFEGRYLLNRLSQTRLKNDIDKKSVIHALEVSDKLIVFVIAAIPPNKAVH